MSLKRRPPANNVRRVHTHGKGVWGTMVNQMSETIQFESGLEKNGALSLIRNKAVRQIISQPIRIPYVDENGKSHTYTPDFMVIFWDGHVEIHEFTAEFRRVRPDIRRREAAARVCCETQGWVYVIHTERDMPGPTEQVNIRDLSQYRPSAYFDERIANCIRTHLADGTHISLIELTDRVSQSLGVSVPLVNNTVFHMLWNEQLCTDLSSLLIFLQGTPNPRALIWMESR